MRFQIVHRQDLLSLHHHAGNIKPRLQLCGVFCTPHGCCLDQTSLFFCCNIIESGSQAVRFAGLYLHKRQILPVFRNDVDLAAADAEIPPDNGIALLFQLPANCGFPQTANLSCFHFHVSDIASAKNWADVPDMVHTVRLPHSVPWCHSPYASQTHTADIVHLMHTASDLWTLLPESKPPQWTPTWHLL